MSICEFVCLCLRWSLTLWRIRIKTRSRCSRSGAPKQKLLRRQDVLLFVGGGVLAERGDGLHVTQHVLSHALDPINHDPVGRVDV